MDCGKHNDMIVLHAFSQGECEKCNCKIDTAHTPCDKVCEKCSEEFNLFKVCGEKL